MKVIITDIEDFSLPVEGEYKLIQPTASIHNCVGCFGCWVKTPGQCVIRDEYGDMGRLLGHCSELVLVSRCVYGSTSPFVKTVLDRSISYIHPDFVVRQGELHHKRRYDNVFTLSAHFYGEDITEQEKATARRLMKANTVNYDNKLGQVCFYRSVEEMEGVLL